MATILLSHGHLKGMHKHFGNKMIHVGIPDRFTVLVHTDPMTLGGVVEGMYEDAEANGSQFSPNLYISMDAEVVGQGSRTLSQQAGIDLIGKMIANIFLMVAAADGSMDEKEIAQFVKTIEMFINRTQGLVQKASHQLLENDLAPVVELMNKITVHGAFTFLSESAKKLRTSFGEEEYRVIAEALYYLADSIANASGGLFAKSKVTEEEAVALKLISTALA